MKIQYSVPLIALALGVLNYPLAQAAGTGDEEAIRVARSVISADRQGVVTDALQLTADEADKFWPLYEQYRAEMDKIGDGLVRVVKEYASGYPNIPDDSARNMLKELNNLQKEKVAKRTAYLNKFGKVLPPVKNLRFAQVENRLDLALQLQMASEIPLAPIEGRLRGEASVGAVAAKGVPGGAIVQTYELTATVAAIDQDQRKVTLVDPQGFKTTVKVGPEAINFDQIKVGDQLRVTATEELVVQMGTQDDSADNGANAVVALAPKGAKPGGVMAQTQQVTATIQAIDVQHHKVALQFPDGTSKVFPARNDVDLSKRKVGDTVVIRCTETLAISVDKT